MAPRPIMMALLLLFLASCDEREVSHRQFRAEGFNPSYSREAETLMADTGRRWNLELFQKDAEDMKYLSFGKEAFFVALYLDDDPILILTNTGPAVILKLSIGDYGTMSPDDLQRLTDEVMEMLSTRFDVEFKPLASSGVEN